MGKIQKISLHESGICRFAFTQEHGIPPGMTDRVIHRWNRLPTPSPGSGQGSRAVLIAFPTSYLSRPIISDSISIINAAPSGDATYIEMFFIRESEEVVRQSLEASSRLISFTPLPNGENFAIQSSFDKWENKDFCMPASHHEKRDFHFSASLPPGKERTLSITLHNQPQDGDALLIREFGGYVMPAGSSLYRATSE